MAFWAKIIFFTKLGNFLKVWHHENVMRDKQIGGYQILFGSNAPFGNNEQNTI